METGNFDLWVLHRCGYFYMQDNDSLSKYNGINPGQRENIARVLMEYNSIPPIYSWDDEIRNHMQDVEKGADAILKQCYMDINCFCCKHNMGISIWLGKNGNISVRCEITGESMQFEPRIGHGIHNKILNDTMTYCYPEPIEFKDDEP